MRVAWAIVAGIAVLWASAEYGAVLRAEPAGVTIKVRDDAGAGVAGVRVSARIEEYARPEFSNPTTVARGETDKDGTVRLAGLDSKQTYTLVVTAPDARWKEFHDRCLTAWSPKDTTVNLAAPHVLRGVVRDSSHNPVPFARVFVSIGNWESAIIADKKGAFAFLNAPHGGAELYAEVGRKKGEAVRGATSSVASDATAVGLLISRVPTDRQPYLIVRVKTPGGRPVMHGNASFSGERRVSGMFSSSVFSAGSLEGGAARSTDFSMEMSVEIVGARSEFGEPLQCGPGKGGPYGPGPREGTLKLPPELPIEGRVLGPDKKPLLGIRVQALHKRSTSGFGTWLGSAHGDGVSNADGRFKIGGLGKHEYELRCVETDEFVGGRGSSKGGAKDVELVMRSAAAPTLTFRDESGAPVVSAVVRVKAPERDRFPVPEEEAQREAQTDAKGKVRIRGLDPKVKYLLTAYPPTGRPELLTWEIKDWVPKDTALTFEVARRITGLVRDQNRRVVPGARVQWTRPGASSTAKTKPKQVTAGDDGRFALEKLRPGRYEVLARRPEVKRTGTGPAPSESKDASKPVTIEAGKEDVSLKVNMPDTITLRVWGWDKALGKPTIVIAASGDEAGTPAPVTKRLNKDGIIIVKGLRWDLTYALWMGELKHGKYVYEAGVRPRDEKLTSTVKDGATVTGKLVAPKGTTARKVWAVYPGFMVKGKIKSGGRFEIVGLPPGPWTLRGCGKLGKALLETDVPCESGQEPVITLEPK